MTYEDFASAQSFFLWSIFAIALIMGAVVNKTNFCTMGAVSDWVNIGDTGRLRAWMLAIAVGVLGVTALEAAGLVNVTSTFPPYRQTNLAWLENVLGGVLFGIGMTLASGCGNKTLIRIGGGNLKSVVVFFVLGISAYMTLKGLFGVWRVNTIDRFSFRVDKAQDIPTLLASTLGWERGAAGDR